MDFECAFDEFRELKSLLARHLPAYSLRRVHNMSWPYATEGYSWITARGVEQKYAYRSGRRATALLRAEGIASKKIGSRVFYEQAAVVELHHRLTVTLSVEQASRYLGFSSSRGLRPYIASGRIQVTTIAGLTRIEGEEIERFREWWSSQRCSS
jgi:hypothetical protein